MMKKNYFFIHFLIILSVSVNQTLAQHGTCPRNLIDCKHGCGRFIDTDNDGYCDYSLLSDAVKQMLEKNKIAKDTTNSIKKINSEKKETPFKKNSAADKNTSKSQQKIAKDSIDAIQKITKITKLKTVFFQFAKKAKPMPAAAKPYDLITLSLLTLVLYTFTYLLSRFKIIHRCNHRKIWNTLLLATFIMACLLGLVLVIQINYNVLGNWYKDFLFLHVEFGISMTIIAIFHVLWHWKYFKNLPKIHEKNKN